MSDCDTNKKLSICLNIDISNLNSYENIIINIPPKKSILKPVPEATPEQTPEASPPQTPEASPEASPEPVQEPTPEPVQEPVQELVQEPVEEGKFKSSFFSELFDKTTSTPNDEIDKPSKKLMSISPYKIME